MKLSELLEKDLAGYWIQECYEVFKINDDGRKTHSIGYFRSEDIAKAFAGAQVDAPWHSTQKAVVLTNGTHGFLLTREPVTLFSDERAMLDIQNAARAKLSEAEQRVLGLR